MTAFWFGFRLQFGICFDTLPAIYRLRLDSEMICYQAEAPRPMSIIQGPWVFQMKCQLTLGHSWLSLDAKLFSLRSAPPHALI